MAGKKTTKSSVKDLSPKKNPKGGVAPAGSTLKGNKIAPAGSGGIL